jgi:hypothetical protein
MSLDPFEGSGSTPLRRKFWNEARNAVLSLRKVAGRNVTVDEHPGKGTVINISDTSSRRHPVGGGSPGATGACCIGDVCSIRTAASCASAGGHYLGNGTTCSGVDCTHGACCFDDGSCAVETSSSCSGHYQGNGTLCEGTDCTDGGTGTSGACCVGSVCSISTPAACATAGGTYQGDNSVCDPNPCYEPCACGFGTFDGSPGSFRTRSYSTTFNASYDIPSTGETCSTVASQTFNESYDPITCVYSSSCSGSYTYDFQPAGGGTPEHLSGDPCGVGLPGGCSFCAGDCTPYIGVAPTCSDTGCSCSRTSMNCSHSGGDSCGTDGSGTCDTTVTWTVSDECL